MWEIQQNEKRIIFIHDVDNFRDEVVDYLYIILILIFLICNKLIRPNN